MRLVSRDILLFHIGQLLAQAAPVGESSAGLLERAADVGQAVSTQRSASSVAVDSQRAPCNMLFVTCGGVGVLFASGHGVKKDKAKENEKHERTGEKNLNSCSSIMCHNRVALELVIVLWQLLE